MSTSTDDQAQDTATSAGTQRRGMKDVWLYAAARIALFIAITFILMGLAWIVGAIVPLPVLGVLALLIAMPAAVFAFPKLRARANEGVTDWTVERNEHKRYMREELSGRE